MWWHGGAGLTDRSERRSLSAVATHDVFGILNSVCAHQVSLAGLVINNNPEFGHGRIVNAAVAENAPRSIVLGILIKYFRPLRIGQLPAFLSGC